MTSLNRSIKPTDFSNVGEILGTIGIGTRGETGGGTLTQILKIIDSLGPLLQVFLPFIVGLLQRATPGTPVAPLPPAVAPPPPAAPSAEPQVIGLVYKTLRTRILFFEQNRKNPARPDLPKILPKPVFDEIVRGDNAQLVGEFAHMDTSPFDAAGREVRTGDPRHYPDAIVRHRWWINGVQQHDSGDDHFNLGSATDDFGFTPTLKLTRQWGPGKGKAEFESYIPAEFTDDGKEMTGNRVSWWVD